MRFSFQREIPSQQFDINVLVSIGQRVKRGRFRDVIVVFKVQLVGMHIVLPNGCGFLGFAHFAISETPDPIAPDNE